MDKVSSTQAKHDSAIQQISSTQAKHDSAIQQISSTIQQISSTQAKHDFTIQQISSTQAKHDSAIQQISSTQAKHDSAIQQVTNTQAEHEAAIQQLSKPVDVENTLVVDIPPYISISGLKNITADNESAFYLSFENVFRGAETEIDKRQRLYLTYALEAYKYAKDGKYFLDVGCGRGEFLKILNEAAVPAKGLEINREDYKNLKSRDFDVKLVDANTFLEGIDDNTLTGLSSFQVIEHLTQEYLKKFLKLAYRKIALNSVIILETVNPKCSYALSNFFYLDPSHIRPYPPELLKLLLEWYGFRDIKIIYSSPCPEDFRVKNAQEQNYMDYAVVGWKK
jgi:O-antigen chain-terminating methyltransferase